MSKNKNILIINLKSIRYNNQIKDFCIKTFDTLKERMKNKNDFTSEFSSNGKFIFNIKVSFLNNSGNIDTTIDYKTGKNEDILKNITDFYLNDENTYSFVSIMGEDVSDRFISDINNEQFSESLFNFLFTSMI